MSNSVVALFSVLCLLGAPTLTSAEYKEFKSNSTTIKVLGKSGKFTIKPAKGNGATITMDYLHEKDSDGKTVGNTGSVKHSIQTFASQDFTFGTVERVEYQNSSTLKLDFETSISTNIGKMSLTTYIFEQQGMVNTSAEAWNVSPGDAKFNIKLHDWTWCNPCKTKNGHYIDVGIEIKGKKVPEKKPGKTESFSLGDGVDLQLSNEVLVDGSWTKMPSGYPKVEVKGSKTLFVFRFPKFTTEAIYDPLFGLSEATESTTNPENPVSSASCREWHLFVFVASSLVVFFN